MHLNIRVQRRCGGILLLLSLLHFSSLLQQSIASFTVLPLGVHGGFDDADLSCYLASAGQNFHDQDQPFVALDGGNIIAGLKVAEKKGALSELVKHGISSAARPGYFLQQLIKAYLPSHAHLDHVKGMVIDAVEDVNGKTVMGIPYTITNIRNHLFNNIIFPDFGPTGLKKYNYTILNDTVVVPIPQTPLTVEGYHLRHAYPYLSTAFLIKNQLDEYLLYFGDLGPDSVENTRSTPNDLDTNKKVWKRVAPLVQSKKLLAIFMECSYADPRAPSLLFGHLSPQYYAEELAALETEVKSLMPSEKKPLKGLNVVVTHIKPLPDGSNVGSVIAGQLAALNAFEVNFIFPQQGVPLTFTQSGNCPTTTNDDKTHH